MPQQQPNSGPSLSDAGINRNPNRRNIVYNSWRRRGKRSTIEHSEQNGVKEEEEELENVDPDPSMINSEFHIIYKRRDSHVDHMSDYRKPLK